MLAAVVAATAEVVVTAGAGVVEAGVAAWLVATTGAAATVVCVAGRTITGLATVCTRPAVTLAAACGRLATVFVTGALVVGRTTVALPS